MTAVDGDLDDIISDFGSGSRRLAPVRAPNRVNAYSLEEACVACTPIPSPPPVVFIQTTGPRIKGTSALGGGIIRPFRRTEHQDFANDSGIPEVLSCVGEVLGTRKGTLPWRPDFGCDLERLRHKNKTEDFVALAQTMVDDALRRWEPRARVVSVDLDPSPPANALGLEISLLIAGSIKSLKL